MLIVPSAADGRLDPHHALATLAWKGITSILVEGGAQVATEFLQRDLVDELALFRSQMPIGPDGVAAPALLGGIEAGDANRFRLDARHVVGNDRLTVYRRTSN
jgi:diaminohydroxyphosphoribosylaminopyrimidine deaminase/5-amino-6-(5-phosphoribosylamino)uracil reductase